MSIVSIIIVEHFVGDLVLVDEDNISNRIDKIGKIIGIMFQTNFQVKLTKFKNTKSPNFLAR